ncbi:glycosyltransferase [Clostridium autoethanogenum]|uniref:Glycosyltransferase n=1 Tax=Clostridium autoethanogenum DSM 10061 TaxID=1341692 RepID=A0ABN4BJJ4_9CLOT|nr:glycosyltransferase family 2 protein [Clostridium autoethanogenum]AGY77288.1 glycosyltransferase [Clostridium autoethanogenum DSM 10061]ALU37430.1 Glycosyl transferase family 2 [Clostridium autoethanogenum DSM 10061]OVY49077.1 SPBc2 prophage-derived glycosyltransferase SunS [Clostridium autoethanogenum]
MLTLCMIVKNEEENLKNCLSKIANFVDEIVIVDTGSKDSTKSIALEFTDKIYDFKWCSDFSKARNFSISKALNDWILILDADEFVTQFSTYNIDRFINNSSNKNKVGRIQRINIMEDSSGNKKYIERVNRLFNKNYFHYEGIIHEQITALDGKTYETDMLDITAEHVGYTKEVLKRTDKLKRNIDLLEIAVKSNAEDPYLYFQLGKSYYMLTDYKTSVLYFEKALSFNLDFRLEYVEDLVETYGYSLINSNRYSEALILEKCIEIYSKSADFHFLMGLIYMNNAKFTQAIESFLECTKFPYAKVEGITTYISYYNIGVIYEVLGFREKAIEYYNMCGNYEQARNRLKVL